MDSLRTSSEAPARAGANFDRFGAYGALFVGKASTLGAGLLLLFMAAGLALLNLYVSARALDVPLYVTAAFEAVFVLAPSMLVLSLSRVRLPARRLTARRARLVVGMGVTGVLFAGLLTSGWTLLWMRILGTDPAYAASSSVYAQPFWQLVLVVALVPALCEELFFRGILMKSLSANPAAAIILSSALFALMHMDMTRLFGVFALGLFIGWCVMRTGSVAAGMILHFVNNLAAAAMYHFIYGHYDALLGYAEHPEALPAAAQGWAVIASTAVFFLMILSPILFFKFLKRFRRDTEEEADFVNRAALTQRRDATFGGVSVMALAALVMIGCALYLTGLVF